MNNPYNAAKSGRARRLVVKSLAASALAGGMAIGTSLAGAGVAGAAESDAAASLPAGSTFSSGLNQGSSAMSPLNDIIAKLIAQFSQTFHSPIPGPFVGSSGIGSSESILDFNIRN